MYPIPPNETLIEERTCKHCSTKFPITDKDMEFYEKASPSFHGKKYIIPPPTLCPDCRQQRRLSFHNERKFYKRTCNATGKDIISIYSPDKLYTVYHQDYWWSDKWNPLDYGKEFDFSRSAMEQMGELLREVPKMAQVAFNNENSPYANFAANNCDVYLSPDIMDSSNVYYSSTIKKTHDSLDSLDLVESENCYECIGSQRLYNCKYCIWSADCRDSMYLYGCHNMQNSMFCMNIDNKKYHILNQKVSESEFKTVVEDIKNGNLKKYKDQYDLLFSKSPQKSIRVFDTDNSIGDLLKNTKNATNSFQSINIEDCRYVVVGFDMKNCMDTTIHNPNCENDYEAVSGGVLQNAWFNNTSGYSNNIGYCFDCFHSSHLFLCSGLRNASYCILNKQYTKEEYEILVPQIIEHMMKTEEWGEFFPSSLSPFGYNETVAQEYFPLTQSEATKDGIFNWSNYEPPFPQVSKIIPAHKLPENIQDIPDDILNWAIECEITKKPFRIIKQELEFYRKHSLPIPRCHPDQRHLDRMAQRNPRKLYERLCDCPHCEENHQQKGIVLHEGKNAEYADSNSLKQNISETNPQSSVSLQTAPLQRNLRKNMITTYSPDRPEIVYCEVCYEREVVG